MRFISFDPGLGNNFAFIIWESKRGKVYPVHFGNLQNPIENSHSENFQLFVNEITELRDTYQITWVFVEGFVTRRGKIKGNVAVKVGHALSLMWSVFKHYHCVYPSTWKTWIKKRLSEKYRKHLKTKYNLKNKHQADAAGIMLYFVSHPPKNFISYLY